MPDGLTVLLIVVGIVAVVGVLVYNGLVRARNEVENSWAQIDVQLRRRHDLVPNLVATVQGYAGHERALLERVTEARAEAMRVTGAGPKQAAQVGIAESRLSAALGGLLVVAENYPDLKAGQNFLALQEELASTENRIAFARQAYNDATAVYNTRRESFPGLLFAGAFARRDFLEIDDPLQRQSPDVATH